MPFVSIVIPTHNRPDFLKRAITSVLNQTYTDWELLVVDDGDKVLAETIVADFGNSKIKYLKTVKPNSGGSAARNVGIKNANGEVIAFLDDDDEWLSEKLEKQIKIIKENKKIGFVFCSINKFNIMNDNIDSTHVLSGINNYYPQSLRRFKGIMTSTIIIKKQILLKVGGFNELLPSHQEAELMIRVAKNVLGYGVDEPLVNMYIDDSREHVGGNYFNKRKGREMVLEIHNDEYKKDAKLLAFHYQWLGFLCRDNLDLKSAINYFYLSLKKSFSFRTLFHFLLSLIKLIRFY